MTKCNRCGSEVENPGAFCPFCGDSLQSSPSVPEKSADDSTGESNPNLARETKTTDDEPEANDSAVKAPEVDLIDTTERKSADADEQGNPLVPQDDVPEVAVVFEQEELPGGIENQNEFTLNEYDEAEVKEGVDVEKMNDDSSLFTSAAAENGNSDDNENAETPFDTVKTTEDSEALNTGEIKNSQSENFPDTVVEKKPDDEPDDGAKNSPPVVLENLAETEFHNAPSVNIENEQAEPRAQTTPNIGSVNTDGKKSAKLKPLDAGALLNGRYEIVRKIGGGGMGAVYLATDKNLNGTLRAVKEMVQSYIEDAQQEKAVADFKRESVLLTSLEHHSIPTIYDYFFDETEGRFYLVMKYISGGDLSLRLRAAPENRIDERSVTEWAAQIADVLDYLHNRQPPIVYRDLKPANIMVDGTSGRAMLIDFGIARWVNKEEKGVTAVGTMGYAPPELFSGNVEPRSDIYSLGSTMFHLLTGADPQSNPLLIFDFQKHPRPRQINPQLSDQIEKILMRAVEYSADKRFASAAELRGELEKHLENLDAGKVTFGVKAVPHSVALSEQPVFCGFCGQKIVATDMFCAFCGAKQPLAQKGVHREDYAPERQTTAQLLVIGTNELQTPAFFIEKDDNLLGRRDPMSNIFPEVDLSKYDPQTKISRRHARIRREGENFLVEDLGSSNGTTVLPGVKQAVRLSPHKPYALSSGDKLKLGDTTLHFISN